MITFCLSPCFFLKVMLESSVYLALSVYCCCCLLAAIASCALPIETTGRGLQESSQREWGQEMVGRAPSQGSEGIPQSSSGSQGWKQAEKYLKELTASRKRGKEARHSFLCPSPILWLFRLGTTAASESLAAQQLTSLLLYSLQPPLLSQLCNWPTAHRVSGEIK